MSQQTSAWRKRAVERKWPTVVFFWTAVSPMKQEAIATFNDQKYLLKVEYVVFDTSGLRTGWWLFVNGKEVKQFSKLKQAKSFGELGLWKNAKSTLTVDPIPEIVHAP